MVWNERGRHALLARKLEHDPPLAVRSIGRNAFDFLKSTTVARTCVQPRKIQCAISSSSSSLRLRLCPALRIEGRNVLSAPAGRLLRLTLGCWRLRFFAWRALAFYCGFSDFDAFTGIVVTDLVADPAGDFGAVVAIGLLAMLADQRAYSRRLAAHGVERIEPGDLHIELRLSVFVEQRQRPLRRGVPVSINGTRVAADSA